MGRRGRQRRVIHDEDDDLDHTYDKLPSRRATKTVSYKETDEDEDVVEELGGIKDVPDDAALNINEVEAPDLKMKMLWVVLNMVRTVKMVSLSCEDVGAAEKITY